MLRISVVCAACGTDHVSALAQSPVIGTREFGTRTRVRTARTDSHTQQRLWCRLVQVERRSTLRESDGDRPEPTLTLRRGPQPALGTCPLDSGLTKRLDETHDPEHGIPLLGHR